MNINPCPYCGDNAKLETFEWWKGHEAVVKCMHCNASGPLYSGLKTLQNDFDENETLEKLSVRAIEAWNSVSKEI